MAPCPAWARDEGGGWCVGLFLLVVMSDGAMESYLFVLWAFWGYGSRTYDTYLQQSTAVFGVFVFGCTRVLIYASGVYHCYTRIAASSTFWGHVCAFL